MALDIVDVAIGIAIGGTVVAIVAALMRQASRPDAPEGLEKLTSGWRLRELGVPIIVARDVVDVPVPDGARIFASGLVSPDILSRCNVQQVPPVRTEFAFDENGGRAILFTAGVREGTLAFITVDPAVVERLETEWRTLAARAADYVERLAVRDLAGKAGVVVETRGVVQECMPFQDRFMVRLEDQGAAIGVVVGRDASELEGQRVLVRGELRKEETGYPVIVAKDLRRIR